MAILDKNTLLNKILTLFLDNNTQEISEEDLREVSSDIVDTLVALISANEMQFGDSSATSIKSILFDTGSLNLPEIRWNNGSGTLQFSHDGIIYSNFGGGVSGITEGGVTFGDGVGGIIDDAPNLFYDVTNKRLGIGTNTPLYLAHFIADDTIGASQIMMEVRNDGAANSNFKLVRGTTNDHLELHVGNNFQINRLATGSTEFNVSTALEILQNVSDFVKIRGQLAGERGRLGLFGDGALNSGELGAYNGVSPAFLEVKNLGGGIHTTTFDSGKVEIVGGEDAIQLRLRANATQNNSIFEVQDSLGSSTYLGVDGDGNIFHLISSVPTGGITNGVVHYVDDFNGVGTASPFIVTEDGETLNLRKGTLDKYQVQIDGNVVPYGYFDLQGTGNSIVSIVSNSTLITTIDYYVKTDSSAFRSRVNGTSESAIAANFNLWVGGDNTAVTPNQTSPAISESFKNEIETNFFAGASSVTVFMR